MYRGLDVSHYDGEIDWARVAAAGIRFAYLKATQGAYGQDPSFAVHLAGCIQHGVLHGAYHYLTPGDPAAAQAHNFVSRLGGKVGQLPPAVDIEPTFGEEPHVDLWTQIPLEQRVEKLLKFCDAVQAATGVAPIVYASPSFVEETLGSDPRLAKYELWVAEYDAAVPRVPKPFSDYRCWQFSETGSVAGVAGPVDMNLWHGVL